MASLQIKNVPEDLHAELRRRAEESGMAVRDYVLELIRSDQRLPSKADWLARVTAREPSSVKREAIIEALHAGRDTRRA